MHRMLPAIGFLWPLLCIGGATLYRWDPPDGGLGHGSVHDRLSLFVSALGLIGPCVLAGFRDRRAGTRVLRVVAMCFAMPAAFVAGAFAQHEFANRFPAAYAYDFLTSGFIWAVTIGSAAALVIGFPRLWPLEEPSRELREAIEVLRGDAFASYGDRVVQFELQPEELRLRVAIDALTAGERATLVARAEALQLRFKVSLPLDLVSA